MISNGNREKEIFTIGYSNQSIQAFSNFLSINGIEVLTDVRSVPFSKFKPEFSKDRLSSFLRANGIRYLFLGDLLGARINDPACYINGKADYSRISSHPIFNSGITRLKNGIEKYRIALMCAESDPITCHRTILVGRAIRNHVNNNIKHILGNGMIEENESLEQRLLKLHGLDSPDFFQSKEEKIQIAYNKQGDKIAFKLEESLT